MKIILAEATYYNVGKLIALTLLMDGNEREFKMPIEQYKGIEYISYGEELSSILMLNTEGMTKFNQIIKKIKKGKLLSFPIYIGEFD